TWNIRYHPLRKFAVAGATTQIITGNEIGAEHIASAPPNMRATARHRPITAGLRKAVHDRLQSQISVADRAGRSMSRTVPRSTLSGNPAGAAAGRPSPRGRGASENPFYGSTSDRSG